MAILKKGSALTSKQLQPGWTYNEDAYGLVTSSTSFKMDYNSELASEFVVGAAHPVESFLKAHKYSVRHDNLEVSTVTIDYAGIIYTGGYTLPQMTNSNALGSENITTHVNFFTNATNYSDVIAGPAPYTQSDKGPQIVAKGGIASQSFIGENGACFERSDGGRFIGFVDPEFKEFYGKTNYLAPVTSFSGVIYTEVSGAPTSFINKLGWASANKDWGSLGVDIIPDYFPMPTSWSTFGPTMLLSNVNIEQFAGTLFKITYEVRFNAEGWSTKVYKSDAS